MVNFPLITGFYTSHVVQDFFHQQYEWEKFRFSSRGLKDEWVTCYLHPKQTKIWWFYGNSISHLWILLPISINFFSIYIYMRQGTNISPNHPVLLMDDFPFGKVGRVSVLESTLYICWGLNSHYFHIIGDGHQLHQPNSRGLYTHY